MTDADVLTGPRITLRAPTLDDAESLFAIASDPEVPRYMSWRLHRNVGETRRVITEVLNAGGETTRLIDLRDGASVIGAVYRVSAYCHVDNTASARVLERKGLTLEGRLQRYTLLPNISSEPQDWLLFAKAVK